MTPEPNRPDEREAAARVLAEMRALGMPPCVFAHAAEEIAALDLAIALLRRDAPREGASPKVSLRADLAAAYERLDRNMVNELERDSVGAPEPAVPSQSHCNFTHAEAQRAADWLHTNTPELLAALADRAPREGGEACKACGGRGWTEEGDPEVGHAPFDCETCNGVGAILDPNGGGTPYRDCPHCASSDAPLDAVGALVGKWRERANECAAGDNFYGITRAGMLDACADELAAALSSRPVVDEAAVERAAKYMAQYTREHWSGLLPHAHAILTAALRAPEQTS